MGGRFALSGLRAWGRYTSSSDCLGVCSLVCHGWPRARPLSELGWGGWWNPASVVRSNSLQVASSGMALFPIHECFFKICSLQILCFLRLASLEFAMQTRLASNSGLPSAGFKGVHHYTSPVLILNTTSWSSRNILLSIHPFLINFLFLETVFLCVVLAVLGLIIYRPGWSQIYSALPASASAS